MPTICKKDTCRNKAVYGYCYGKPLFCLVHREPNSRNTRFIEKVGIIEPSIKKCRECENTLVLPRYKGYCTPCYIRLFPLDPLSLQTIYKSKNEVIQRFIDSKFDGFIHNHGISKIEINGINLYVVYDIKNIQEDEKNIIIQFNPNKYVKPDGKYANPALYTRLSELEKEIAKEIEKILAS
jgi:hypothetical protein